MNIFVLDEDPAVAAQAHHDIHVISQTKETAQLLCFALHRLGLHRGQERLYSAKGAHAEHPCSKWASEALPNFLWLARLGFALAAEYQLRSLAGAYPSVPEARRGAMHGSAIIIATAVQVFRTAYPGDVAQITAGTSELRRTPWVQVMPQQFRGADAVQAYRRYYREAKAVMKGKAVTWTTTGQPPWWYQAGSQTEIWGETEEM